MTTTGSRVSKLIVLIGGMPTAGKSTLAKNLSRQLHLPWISTDQIGLVMRGIASRDEHPRLFTWESYLGMHSLDELTADEIVENEFAKAEANWPGIRKLIQEDFTWEDGFIVEGDDLLPHLIARDLAGT